MTGMAVHPPWVLKVPALIVLLMVISSCTFGGSSPVNAESIQCVNGNEGEDGGCVCDNCWTGQYCEQRVQPQFPSDEVRVPLDPTAPDNVIFVAQAVAAEDEEEEGGEGEVCEDIQYSFLAGNDHGHFSIDKATGEVRVNEDVLHSAVPLLWEDQVLIIQAHSPLSALLQDTMTLRVQQLQQQQQGGSAMMPDRLVDLAGEDLTAAAAAAAAASYPHHHHRHKRAVITLPENVNFTLSKTGSSSSLTEMRVGTRVSFELQILFPRNTTDMLVELFAPDNESMVMMLCDVKVQQVGVNLQHTGPATVVMDSQNKSSKYFDRAIIDFGNVTNTFSSQSDARDSSIFISWDAVMIANDKTQHDQLYWVSAGAEYNYDMEVWVGQASFTAKTDTDPATFDPPVFNLSGPSSMMVGSSAVFRLDMFIDSPSVTLSVEAFAPLNTSDVMSICDMQVVDAGQNYQCGFKAEEVGASLFRGGNTRGYDRARLQLMTLTNKGSREASNPAANNRISVEFLVHVYEDAAYVGNSYTVAAAVEIGPQKIWAGQIQVLASAFTPTSGLKPSLAVVPGGSGKVSTVSPLLMTLDITLQQSTTGKYALEVLAPFNHSAAVFQLCSLRVVGVGTNMACLNSTPSPSYSSRGSPQHTDRVYLDLGVVSNVGPWGWQPYNLTQPSATPPDVLRLQFMVKATDHALATPGSQHGVTLGLYIGDARIVVGTYTVEVEAPPTLPNITAETTPVWALAFLGGSDNVRIGGAGQLLLTITTRRNTVYAPFDLEALMPNSSTGGPQVSLCRVHLHSVGSNLPCVLPTAVNRSITFTSSFNVTPAVYDRAALSLQSLCNQEVQNDTEQDKLVLKVGFKLHANAGLTNGTELWPSVGVMFSPYKMWVGQLKAVARDDLPNAVNTPHVAVVKLSGLVPLGYVARYQVLVKTVPGNLVSYTLNLSLADPGLSLCSLRILQVGANMPCTNASAIEALYEPGPDGRNVKASLHLDTVANVGTGSVATTSTVDDNTVVVEVGVGLTSDTAVIADSSSHSFSLVIQHGAASLTPSVPPFTATHDLSSLASVGANVSRSEVKVMPITETDNATEVVLGQSKRVEMCAWTYPGSLTRLSFKMMTPQGQPGAMELVSVRTSFGGSNLPCARSCTSGALTYTSRAGSVVTDIGTVDFGYLLNNNFDTVDPDANKVCVDGIFRVLKTGGVAVGTVLKPAASLNVNNVEISVVEQALTLVDNATFTDIFLNNATLVNNTLISLNSSVPDPLCLTPGDVQTLPILLTIPPFLTSLVSMDLKLEVDQSACMTFRDLRLVSVGRNLKGLVKEGDLQCTPNSTMGTSQMDNVLCSLGVVTNPAMSHRCGDRSPDDDAIYLEAEVQMADCRKADKDALTSLSLGLKVAGYIAILSHPVKVCRSGPEAPVYNVSAQANSTGSLMYLQYDLGLANSSQAEVHNASLVLSTPPYLLLDSLHSSSGTNGPPSLITSSPSQTVILLGSLYLTDAVRLVVVLKAAPGYKVPSGISGQMTVVTHHLSGQVLPRTGSTLTSTTVWSDLDFLNFTATTTTAAGTSCTSSSLKLQDSGVIYDCQLSSSRSSSTPAFAARKGAAGWSPYVRSGSLSGARYFQVYFANSVKVDRVEVTQAGPGTATQLKLAYSNDGRAFLDGDTISLGSAPPATQTVTVPNPRESKVLRVYITESTPPDQKVTLTFEFYGCVTGTGGPTGQKTVCAEVNAAIPPLSPDSLFFQRSFLATATGTVFVCDGVVNTRGVVSRCFTSKDGATWQPLDTRVAAMVGHDPDTQRVFALSEDGTTFMSSGDQGLTWASIPRSVLTKAQAGTLYLPARDVPWVGTDQLQTGTPLSAYQSNNWGANYNYLQKNDGTWTNKIKWNCCP